jgi:hypothetical protein
MQTSLFATTGGVCILLETSIHQYMQCPTHAPCCGTHLRTQPDTLLNQVVTAEWLFNPTHREHAITACNLHAPNSYAWPTHSFAVMYCSAGLVKARHPTSEYAATPAAHNQHAFSLKREQTNSNTTTVCMKQECQHRHHACQCKRKMAKCLRVCLPKLTPHHRMPAGSNLCD